MRECGILLPVASLPSKYGIGGFSREAVWFVSGLLEHMKAMTAVSNPLVNSYSCEDFIHMYYTPYPMDSKSSIRRSNSAWE